MQVMMDILVIWNCVFDQHINTWCILCGHQFLTVTDSAVNLGNYYDIANSRHIQN